MRPVRLIFFIAAVAALASDMLGSRVAAVDGCNGGTIALRFDDIDYAIPCEYFPNLPVVAPFFGPRSTAADLGQEPAAILIDMYLPDFTARPTQDRSPDRIDIWLTADELILNASYANAAAYRDTAIPFHDALGLRALRATSRVGSSETGRDIYFSHTDNVVDRLIVCSLGHRVPPCEHSVNAAGLGVTLTYPMAHLGEWRAIETGVLKRLASFRKPPR